MIKDYIKVLCTFVLMAFCLQNTFNFVQWVSHVTDSEGMSIIATIFGISLTVAITFFTASQLFKEDEE